MFKLSEIKELIKLVDSTSVQELEVENEGSRLVIRKPGKAEVAYVPAPQAVPAHTPAAPAAAAIAPLPRPRRPRTLHPNLQLRTRRFPPRLLLIPWRARQRPSSLPISRLNPLPPSFPSRRRRLP